MIDKQKSTESIIINKKNETSISKTISESIFDNCFAKEEKKMENEKFVSNIKLKKNNFIQQKNVLTDGTQFNNENKKIVKSLFVFITFFFFFYY